MYTIECQAVYLWDGGERQNFGFHITGVTTKAIEQAHPHCRVDNVTLVVFDSLEEVAESDHRKVYKRVWDKLTPLERKVLKLEPPRP